MKGKCEEILKAIEKMKRDFTKLYFSPLTEFPSALQFKSEQDVLSAANLVQPAPLEQLLHKACQDNFPFK